MLVRSLIKATGKIRAENLPANEREGGREKQGPSRLSNTRGRKRVTTEIKISTKYTRDGVNNGADR